MFDHVGKLITTLDFRKAGVMHPSGRIKEMNERMGYYIPTVAVRSMNRATANIQKRFDRISSRFEL